MANSQVMMKQGIDFVTKAIEEDNAGNYLKAMNLYQQGLKYLLHTLKYTPNPALKKQLNERCEGYMKRAEQLKKVMDEQDAAGDGGTAAQKGSAGAKKKKKEKTQPDEAEDLPPIDLEQELAKVVGLDDIKQQLREFKQELLLDKRRQDLGFDIKTGAAPHMVFQGNPGTGKTTIARLVSRVLKDVGRIPRGQLVEVQRSDLVAGYVGQTATKTRTQIDRAVGGVLFVDEAYRLAPQEGGKDFGAEAINEIMSVMNDGDPVMIFAGYVMEMRAFINSNAGFARRIQRTFEFTDYSPLQLAQIAMIMVKGKGFKLNLGAAGAHGNTSVLETLIRDNTDEVQRKKMNAALAKTLVTNAKHRLDRRMTLESTLEDLITFNLDDVRLGLTDIATMTADEGTLG